MYKVGLLAADGERHYEIMSPSAIECYKFLQIYDHEGSQISLTEIDSGKVVLKIHNSEDVYFFLNKRVIEIKSRGEI